jgi:hypothetical protein
MNPINMDTIADHIMTAGYFAYVEHTGGGVMTIYAWRTGGEPNRDATGRPVLGEPDVMAGPGVIREDAPQASRLDFYTGRTAVDAAAMEWGADDYQTDMRAWYEDGPEGACTLTERQLADVIVCQLRAATAQFGERVWADFD